MKNYFKVVNIIGALVIFSSLSIGNIGTSQILTSVLNEDKSTKPTNEITDNNGIALSPIVKEGENPSWYLIQRKADSDFSGKFLVKNMNSQKKLTAKLYVVDVNASDGGFAPSSKDAIKKEATWIKLEKDSIDLKPLESATVSFEGKIPKSATPGQHAMALMGETFDSEAISAKKGKTQVLFVTRVGLRMYVTVEGKMFISGEIGDLKMTEKNPYTFKIQFKNTGNSIIKPSIDTDIFDWKGSKITSLPTANFYEIQPTGEVPMIVRWESAPEFGKFTLKFKVSYSGKSALREIGVIIYPPIRYTLAILTFLLLIITNIILFIRKKNQPIAPQYVTAVPPPSSATPNA